MDLARIHNGQPSLYCEVGKKNGQFFHGPNKVTDTTRSHQLHQMVWMSTKSHLYPHQQKLQFRVDILTVMQKTHIGLSAHFLNRGLKLCLRAVESHPQTLHFEYLGQRPRWKTRHPSDCMCFRTTIQNASMRRHDFPSQSIFNKPSSYSNPTVTSKTIQSSSDDTFQPLGQSPRGSLTAYQLYNRPKCLTDELGLLRSESSRQFQSTSPFSP